MRKYAIQIRVKPTKAETKEAAENIKYALALFFDNYPEVEVVDMEVYDYA